METISEFNLTKSDNKNTTSMFTINVGSRKSQLALIQTNRVIKELEGFYSNNPDKLLKLVDLHEKTFDKTFIDLNFNIVSLQTLGDKVLDTPLPKIGSKSLFTHELEAELMLGKVHFIVHSLKDLPTTLPHGCTIGAVLKRDSPHDTIVLKQSLRSKINPIDLLTGKHVCCKKDYKIGTSSLRRIAMIKRCNPDIQCIDIRGNINTRLSKLDNDEGEYTAIILAQAGLDRMKCSDRGSKLDPEKDVSLNDWCYAVGQGAIAVECKSDDKFILDLLKPVVDFTTTCEVVAERSLMKKLEGGCSVPLGVRSSWPNENCLKLDSIVLSTEGKQVIKASSEINLEVSHMLGEQKHHDIDNLKLSTTAGIEITNFELVYQKKILNCSKLGVEVALQMIEKGCLTLIQNSRC